MQPGHRRAQPQHPIQPRALLGQHCPGGGVEGDARRARPLLDCPHQAEASSRVADVGGPQSPRTRAGWTKQPAHRRRDGRVAIAAPVRGRRDEAERLQGIGGARRRHGGVPDDRRPAHRWSGRDPEDLLEGSRFARQVEQDCQQVLAHSQRGAQIVGAVTRSLYRCQRRETHIVGQRPFRVRSSQAVSSPGSPTRPFHDGKLLRPRRRQTAHDRL